MATDLHRRKLVVFDLDGTIIDSGRDIFDAQVYALSSVTGLDPADIDIALLESLLGKGLVESFTPFISAEQQKLMPELVQAYREYYSRNLTTTTQVFPGMIELLAELKSHRRLTAIATTKFQSTAEMLADHFGLRPYLDFVQATEYDGFPLKPDPHILRVLMQKAGVSSVDTVMVGDTDNDILCAQKAGTASIGITWGAWNAAKLASLNPCAIAHTPSELKQLLIQG